LLGACGGGGGGFVDGGPDTPEVVSAEPDYGSLLGGTKIVITGRGFSYNNASANHVIVGEHEAPAATVIDDGHLEVVLPPGDSPGAVDITVFNSNGYATGTGLFHYSALPTITGVSPAEVVATTGGTVTVTGTGFTEEGAELNVLLIDGEPALDLEIVSDTQLTFTAAPGAPLLKPDLQLTNKRGQAEEADGFEYIVSTNPGLLLFSKDPGQFAFFYDSVTMTVTTIPSRVAFGGGGGTIPRYRSVVEGEDGFYYGQVGMGCCGNTGVFRKFDLGTQVVFSSLTQTTRYPEMLRVGSTVFAMTRNGAFGTVELSTGAFTQIATGISCCSYNLAHDGTTLYLISGGSISVINPTTGVRTGTVLITGSPQIDGARFLGGTLFAYERNNGGRLLSINPTTGAPTVVATLGLQVSSMEARE